MTPAEMRPAPGEDDLDAGAAPTLPVSQNRWAMPAGAVAAGVLGLFVFTSMSGGRASALPLIAADAQAQASSQHDVEPPSGGMDQPQPVPAANPAPALGSEPVPVAAPPPPPPSVALAPAFDAGGGGRAPSLVVDLSQPDEEGGRAAAGAAAKAGGAPGPADKAQDRQSVNERFAAAVDGEQVETVRATALRAPSAVILQGTVIPAVLETALNTDIPGYLRAVVAQDVKSFDGAQTLIPRGSRLIGQYRSAVARGQSRAFVVWSRLIRPDGASIMLASPGGDAQGRAGLTGRVDNHFFRQFGSAILLSVITAGSNALSNTNAATLIIGSGSSTQGPPATQFLDKETDIPPTVKVPQGAPMTIFVAKDLDFADVQRGQ